LSFHVGPRAPTSVFCFLFSPARPPPLRGRASHLPRDQKRSPRGGVLRAPPTRSMQISSAAPHRQSRRVGEKFDFLDPWPRPPRHRVAGAMAPCGGMARSSGVPSPTAHARAKQAAEPRTYT